MTPAKVGEASRTEATILPLFSGAFNSARCRSVYTGAPILYRLTASPRLARKLCSFSFRKFLRDKEKEQVTMCQYNEVVAALQSYKINAFAIRLADGLPPSSFFLPLVAGRQYNTFDNTTSIR